MKKGELASADVIRTLAAWFDQELPAFLEKFSWQDLSMEWERIIKEENNKLLAYGRQRQMNLGTTLTAMLIIKNQYMIVHVGDSRVYRIDEQGVAQLTEDQTFVAREVRAGRMAEEEAKTHAKRNMLLQCVGASQTVVPQILFGEIQAGEVYMLCSDGFRHVLNSGEIYQKLKPEQLDSIESMDIQMEYLVNLVKARMERDNISVALIKCIEAGR